MNGDVLWKLRVKSGLTQADLGAEIGVHWITISRYERDIVPIKPETAVKLADLFNVSPSTFRPDIFRT